MKKLSYTLLILISLVINLKANALDSNNNEKLYGLDQNCKVSEDAIICGEDFPTPQALGLNDSSTDEKKLGQIDDSVGSKNNQ